VFSIVCSLITRSQNLPGFHRSGEDADHTARLKKSGGRGTGDAFRGNRDVAAADLVRLTRSLVSRLRFDCRVSSPSAEDESRRDCQPVRARSCLGKEHRTSQMTQLFFVGNWVQRRCEGGDGESSGCRTRIRVMLGVRPVRLDVVQNLGRQASRVNMLFVSSMKR